MSLTGDVFIVIWPILFGNIILVTILAIQWALLAYLSTGVDEFVFDYQGCRGDDLPKVGVFHHNDVIVSGLLHVLEMFCVETKRICTLFIWWETILFVKEPMDE